MRKKWLLINDVTLVVFLQRSDQPGQVWAAPSRFLILLFPKRKFRVFNRSGKAREYPKTFRVRNV